MADTVVGLQTILLIPTASGLCVYLYIDVVEDIYNGTVAPLHCFYTTFMC